MSLLAAYPEASPSKGGFGRAAVVLSLVLHVVAFLLVLGVPRLLASSSKAAPVYVVDLVSFGGGNPGTAAPPAAAPPAPAPPAAKKAAPEKPKAVTPPPKPKKTHEKAIVIPDKNAKKTPPKETKKPAPTKPEPEPKSAAADDDAPDAGEATESAEPQPAAAAPAAGKSAGPGAPGGTPGGTGLGGQGTGVGGDAYNFYLVLLDRSIKGAWKRPLYNGQDVLSATVRMEISRSGRVLKLDLVTASGNDSLDKSVLKAVRDAEPFPPLPTTLSLDTLPVQIVFELNPQGGTGG
jgi:protein TonB